MYYRLHTIESKEIDKETEEYTKLFKANTSFRIKTQTVLQALSHKDGYYFETLFNNQDVPKNKYNTLVVTLSITAILAVFLTYFFLPISLLFIIILPINLFIHFTNKNNLFEYQLAITQFRKTYTIATNLLNTPNFKHIRQNTKFIESLKELKRTSAFLDFEKKIDNEFTTIIWFPIELIKILFNIEYLAFFKFLSKVEKLKAELHQLFISIGKIDMALTKASILSQEDVCSPTFTDDKELHIKNIYHPLIEECVKNDLVLHNNSLLLTGSNMSGKTTFIRTLTINALLAQTLGIAFAEEYTAPFYQIQSSIRISDNMFNNTSYYLQEVLNIQDFILTSQTDEPQLYVLDEVFKGTNTIERISASYAILKYLNTSNNTILVSTHDIELIDLLKSHNYKIAHFNEKIEKGKIVFDHKLKYGKPTTTNAIKILQLYNYPHQVIEEATRLKNTLLDS